MDGHHEEEEPRFRRWIVVCMSIFLMLLVVSLVLVQGNIGDIAVSLVESSEIENNIVEGDVSVVFEGETYEEILSLYTANLGQEFKVCLLGTVSIDYFVQEVFVPEMYEQAYDHVISAACPEGTIISLHSHPYRHCTASAQDLSNLAEGKKINPDFIIGIMCEDDRFHFYQ